MFHYLAGSMFRFTWNICGRTHGDSGGGESAREVGPQHLDCHRAAMPEIVCHEHDGHPPASQLTLYDVPLRQRFS